MRIWNEATQDDMTFFVWNRQPIPEDMIPRVFQRYFTTKNDPGHGLGTYAVKLLGENLLGGKVGFTSKPSTGTTFWIRLSRTFANARRRPA